MMRTLLLSLALIVVLGGSYYLFFAGKGASDRQTITDKAATAPQAGKPVGDAKASSSAASVATPSANGEAWTQRCNEEGDKHCEVFQRLVTQDTNQRLVEFAVGYPKELKGEAQAVILLPLGVLVSEGIALSVDGKKTAQAPFRTCVATGCIVAANLPEEFLKEMKTGKVMGLSFIEGGSGKQLNVGISLEGFGEKLDNIRP